MIIGVPKEVKDHETRVGLVPSGVVTLREAGHEVLVETRAGEGSAITDREYMQAGAGIVQHAAEVWRKADLIVKVNEPQPSEYGYLRPECILCTYLHLPPLPELTDRLIETKLRELDDIFNGQIVTLASNVFTIGETLKHADLVIGAVLIPGAAAPKVVLRQMIANMKRGSVVVDVAIDQGGCFETSHPTTHTEPVYFVDGVLHYCVSNMLAAVLHTSTFVLNNATFPYLMALANHGLEHACRSIPALRDG